MPSITDIHIHLLPGLDDGVTSEEEVLQVLKTASKQKIRRMIVTPHYYPEHFTASADQVRSALEYVQKLAEREQIPIELHEGQECFYHSELADALDRKEALTMAGSRYVLVEFDPGVSYSILLGGLRQLLQRGYLPILAHFERYECIRQEERLLRLKEEGVRLQMNFDTIRKKDRLFHKNIWRSIAKDGFVDYFGSDCHGMQFRPLHVDEAVQWLEANLEPALYRRIFRDHIQDILKNR